MAGEGKGVRAVDPESLNPDTDPGPAFQVNPDTDQDPIRIQEKKLTFFYHLYLIRNCNLLMSKLYLAVCSDLIPNISLVFTDPIPDPRPVRWFLM